MTPLRQAISLCSRPAIAKGQEGARRRCGGFRIGYKSLLSFGGAIILAASILHPASAQNSDYPSRPVQVYVPFAAGSASELQEASRELEELLFFIEGQR